MPARCAACGHLAMRWEPVTGRLHGLSHLFSYLRIHRYNLQSIHRIILTRISCEPSMSDPDFQHLSATLRQTNFIIAEKFHLTDACCTFCIPPPFGRRTRKRVCSHSASRLNRPLWASTIPLEMLSPNPVPCPMTFVVKNGWPILSRSFSGIPFPL